MNVQCVALLLFTASTLATASDSESSADLECLDATRTLRGKSEHLNATGEFLRCESKSSDKIGSSLVKRDAICREDVLCDNISPCDLGCTTHYRCQNSSLCKPRSTICNGNACDGCPEEPEWNNGPGFKCLRNGERCILPQKLLYDQIADCDGGTDRCFSRPDSKFSVDSICHLDRRKCFRCHDGSMIVPAISVCDGIVDCDDLSDECLCLKKRPEICSKMIMYGDDVDESLAQSQSGFQETDGVLKASNASSVPTRCAVGMIGCVDGKCIRRQQVCDGIADCDTDESFEICRGTIHCRFATNYEETCRCKRRCESMYGTACDSNADCPILLPWDNAYVPERNPFPEDECKAPCTDHPSEFLCESNYGVFDIPVGPIGIYPCQDASTSQDKDQTVLYNSNKKCDGVKNCILGDDELNCPHRFYCADEIPQKFNIPMELKCNGVEDCLDGSDEAVALCEKERFFCSSGEKVNIPRNLTCDFMLTCDNGSDEMNCTDGRFYCVSGEPLFVLENQVADGSKDCSDWSDECQPSKTTFSSRYEMIGNGFLRGLVWVMGWLSVVGNLTVMCRERRKLRKTLHPSPVQRANGFLVVNLAASDFLMGVYLISLAITGLAMRGNYCPLDRWWRSSTACAALGVISVLSSETSVMTMAILTGFKLNAVVKPMLSRTHPTKRFLCTMIALSWATSLTIAFVPTLPSFSAIFVKEAEFLHNPYTKSRLVTLNSSKLLFRRLLTYDAKANVTLPGDIDNYMEAASWETLEADAPKYFKHMRFTREKTFGYYSSNSVCIPKFFVTRSEPAWVFSFVVNLFNFLAFTFVASAYIAIYAGTTRKKEIIARSTKQENDNAKVMQRKIFRLIVTDFVCWTPICTMAFCKLAGSDVPYTAYAVSAIVLLPINSALNPLLYSDLPDVLLAKIRHFYNSTLKKESVGHGIQSAASSGPKAVERLTDTTNTK